MASGVTYTICVRHERSTHCCALRTMQSHIRMVAGFLEHMGRQVLTTPIGVRTRCDSPSARGHTAGLV